MENFTFIKKTGWVCNLAYETEFNTGSRKGFAVL